MTLKEAWQNGGFGMYPVLVLGVVALGSSAYFAARGDGRLRGTLDAVVRALVWATIGATITNYMAVFHALAAEMTLEMRTYIFCQGSYEALSPIPLAAAFLMFSYALVAIGQRRLDSRLPTA